MNFRYKKRFVILMYFLFFSFINNIYAYNQVYETVLKEDDGKYSATIVQSTKATSQNISEYNSAIKDSDGWVNVSGSLNSEISTIAFKFHKNVLSKYNDGFSDVNDGSIINMYYDDITGKAVNIDISDSGIINEDNSVIKNINGTDIVLNRYKIVDDELMCEYVIYNSVLQELLNNSYFVNNGASTTNIRISNVLNYGTFENLDTLAKFFKNVKADISGKYRGFNTDDKVSFNEKNKSFLPVSSVANLYDNIISIPTGNYYGREVYIRHIDSSTGNLITGIGSREQVLISKDGNKSIIKSGTSNILNFDHNEYYRYNNRYQMEISKSLVFNLNGRKYTYVGANVSTANSIDEVKEIVLQKQSLGQGIYDVTDSEIITRESMSDDVTVIDFYYNVSEMEAIDVKIGSETNMWSNSGEISDYSTTYVPSGESLKPYIVAPKYILKDLIYKKEIQNNNVVYRIDNFSVYKLSGGTVKNSSGISEGDKTVLGNIIGISNTSLFNGDGNALSIDFTASTGIINELEDKLSQNNFENLANGGNSISSDFSTYIQVPQNKINGLRYVKGEAVYNTYNVISKTEEYAFSVEANNNHFVNIYTPVGINTPVVTSDVVNHTEEGSVLENGATFTVNITSASPDFAYYQGISNTFKYISRYFVMLDFNVIYNGELREKGELIEVTNKIENGASFTAKIDEVQDGTLSSSTYKIIAFAVASNIPTNELLNNIIETERKIEIEKDPAYLESSRKYINDTLSNLIAFDLPINGINNLKSNHLSSLTGYTMYSDSFYVAKATTTIKTASRIYDFRITDCSDLAFKNVFRNSNSGANINEKTAINYYSGIRRMYIYNSEYNKLIDRENININGTKTKTILPLGPYKHTTASYINAPKMGYRISFDVKTTGYYISDSSKNIQIIPSYYYISKDGTELIEDIDLYYKGENGKYQNFKNSNYTIYFKPNDLYRDIEFDSKNMSDKMEALNIASDTGYFTLNDKMMSVSDTLYMQAWYGEFKLPNSTIAVRAGESIRSALTNGYIGVKFEIKCVDVDDTGTVVVSYNQNDKSANNTDNTSQWDYEGFLGFSNIGQKLTENTSLRLQLENGIWNIDSDDKYNFVKGTVVLFDLDNRAATDFE